MKDFLFALITICLIIPDVIIIMAYSEAVNSILKKDPAWIVFFLIWIALLFCETALLTWLPGRIGAQISYFDGSIVFEDGAIFKNMGYALLIHVLGTGAAMAKYLWAVIRRKEKFYGKLILLELVIAAACGYISWLLIKNEYVIDFQSGEKAGHALMYVLAAAGAVLFIAGIKKYAGKKEGKAAGENDADRRYEQVMAERKRLAQAGDYASLIPLLIQATGLDIDRNRKALIWSFLGSAYEEISSPAKAEECYNTALRIHPEEPAANNNLALLYSGKGEHAKALQYMKRSVKAREKSGNIPGIYYYNYALLLSRSGNKDEAAKYLRLAEKAGYDKDRIAGLRGRLQL